MMIRHHIKQQTNCSKRIGMPLLVVRMARRLFSSGKVRGKSVLDELRQRGLVSQVSQPERLLHEKLQTGQKLRLYCGADPTARSLHLGNMVPLMVLLNFYVRGHDIVALVGGATGRVGDPSGRKTERTSMEDTTRMNNIERIQSQLERFFRNGLKYYSSKRGVATSSGEFISQDNYNWWKDVKMLDFLACYGRHIRIQSMLSRESISARLGSSEGLGFNEFTYQILQAYDFYHLYKEENVSLQVGGNDQWGNITAGIDLIGRLDPRASKEPAFGLTTPLLTTSTGEKFGKSAGNAIFIDPEINTYFDIYQFFYNTADADVCRFLKIFTLLPIETIEEAAENHQERPQLREGQKLLAREVTDLLHGPGTGQDAEMLSDIIFGDLRKDGSFSPDKLTKIFKEARLLHPASRSETLVNLVSRLNNVSKSAAARMLKQGSVYLGPNRSKVTVDPSDWSPYLIDGHLLILRIGKQKCVLIKME